MLPVVPPESLEAGEPDAEGQGPVVGCFSQPQLSYLAAATLKLQFRRRPPACGRLKIVGLFL